jgi:FMN phosphatase YigB (HAD superfamily)
MIKAIAFDLGGVLFAEGKSVAMERLETEYGYKKDTVRKILVSPQSVDLRKGLIEDVDFWTWAQGQLPQGYSAELIKKEWYDGYLLDEAVLELVKGLKGKYRIIAFSGNIKSRIEFLEEKYSFRSLLHIEVYSFDYHRTKPDKRFVELMIEKSGYKPDEIVYIEDNDQYAQVARELGVKVLLYSRGDIRKLERALQELGIQLPSDTVRNRLDK